MYGNCQANAIRQLLAAAEGFRFVTVQIPPAQEITAAELKRIQPLLRRASLFVTQQVRDDYRGLPTGTAQLTAHLPASARVLTYPVMFYEGLHPWQVYVRLAGDVSTPAPHTSYHDLRLLHAAGSGWPVGKAIEWLTAWQPSPAALRELSDGSVRNLAEREQRLDVRVSDAIQAAGPRAFHSINHPGTRLLAHAAQQVCDAVGDGKVVDPDRELLGSLHSPLEAPTLRALGFDLPPEPFWVIGRRRFSLEEIARAHLEFYEERPDVLAAGLRQHAERMERHDLAVA